MEVQGNLNMQLKELNTITQYSQLFDKNKKLKIKNKE